jgi:hypothetical protein
LKFKVVPFYVLVAKPALGSVALFHLTGSLRVTLPASEWQPLSHTSNGVVNHTLYRFSHVA